MIHVLFVCLGNICRSPLAEGVFQQLLVKQGLTGYISCDSAATSTYEIGNHPDPRTLKNAQSHGLTLDHRSQQITRAAFDQADYVIGMDYSNIENIHRVLKLGDQSYNKISLMRDFDPEGPGEVPDPYYGTEADFELTYQLIARSAEGLLADIIREHRIPA